ncbi:MAG: WYL domain-containing protein, partial [Acidimicrobiia bacterium]|nr:WYL domain-containing protein [Acidimicrobiia bacterium]
VIKRYPVDDAVERADGSVEARFPVASDRWLERLLLRLGGAVEVVEPTDWRDRAAAVAARVLVAYEA